MLANYLLQLNNANEQEDGNEEVVSGTVSLVAGSTIPSGYFYITNINGEEQDEEYVFTADCYAVSENEIANYTTTLGGYRLVLNYNGSTMPDADTFEDKESYLYCMNTGFVFGYAGNGLVISVDENIRTEFTSISTINNIIDGRIISLYGYNQVKGISLIGCTAIVDASTLNISGCTKFIFGNCTSLTKVPTIPTTVTNIENSFRGCTSLTEVTYPKTIAEFKQISGYRYCGNNGLIVKCSDGNYIAGQE